MMSSGFETTITMALGACSTIARAACLTIPAFTLRRSIRSIPGFRASPAVITTTLLSAIWAKSLVPTMEIDTS